MIRVPHVSIDHKADLVVGASPRAWPEGQWVCKAFESVLIPFPRLLLQNDCRLDAVIEADSA